MNYTDKQKTKIEQFKNNGMSGRSIAQSLGLSKSGVNEFLGRLKCNGYSPKKGARILLFDLESTPSITATFGRFKQNIGLNSVISEGGWLLSIAWKFLGDNEVHSAALSPEEAIAQDDARLVAILYELFEESDFVIAHNGNQFDIPLFKTRLIVNGFPPAKTVKSIDTLQIAKKLKFNSNKLDGLTQQLKLVRKIENSGMPLWLGCMSGNQESLDTMETYNKGDIDALEQVYLALRAFDMKAPNNAHYHNDDKVRCHVCGSENVNKTGHSVFTAASEFAEIQCGDCGARGRTRYNQMSQTKRKTLISNVV